MEQVLGLRPFVPSRDMVLSRKFYEALGFVATHADRSITVLKIESFSFILQDFYVKEFAENCMVQLMVRNLDEWWSRINEEAMVAEFGVAAPRPPAMQDWGLKVGFLFDPSGVLWHIAETPF